MTLKQLKEAASRYQQNDFYQKDAIIFGQQKTGAALAIADGFTNPTPITREGVLSLGFTDYHNDGSLGLQVGKYEVWYIVFGIIPKYLIEVHDNESDDNWFPTPKPKTIGDLSFLIWMLSREQRP